LPVLRLWSSFGDQAHASPLTESDVKKKIETNGWEETRQLMNEVIKQHLALVQQNIALGKRMDAFGERMDAFGQRMDAFAARMDRMEERMQRVEQRLQRLESNMEVVIDLLHRLPDAVKEKMGFGNVPAKS
jgi:predicted nuclease with TOPRIM domain